MKQNEITNILFNEGTEFIKKRYPKGWGGAAVLRTDQNNYLISVAIETCNVGASLCIETGAICEAHKINEAVTHSICIVRENEDSPFKVLSPCGICQERLMYWDNVLVGVTTQDSSKTCTSGDKYSYDVKITYDVSNGIQDKVFTGGKPIVGVCP